MVPVPFPHRIDALEQALIELACAQTRTAVEMREFKDEMRVFKDEMGEFKDEMGAFKDEMRVFKDEMGEFKDERHVFKDEMRASAERSDRKWGELANKMGTLVEDIVYPGLGRVFQRLFPDQGEPDCAMRVRRKHPTERSRMREFDSLLMSDEVVLVVETKSRLSPADIDDAPRRLSEARDFLPETRGRRLYGALASFYVDASLVRAGERQGLLMLGLDTGLLRVLNTPEFPPRAF